jgi:hypothetical protein
MINPEDYLALVKSLIALCPEIVGSLVDRVIG